MNAILYFVVTCYVFSIALSLVIGYTGGQESALIGLAYVSMFLPAGAVAILSAIRNEPPHVRWSSFPLRYLPVALFLIPETLRATTWGIKQPGARVNVEADILAKHVARLLGFLGGPALLGGPGGSERHPGGGGVAAGSKSAPGASER
jgi:hypothetical protein